MRKTILLVALCAALIGCKKEYCGTITNKTIIRDADNIAHYYLVLSKPDADDIVMEVDQVEYTAKYSLWELTCIESKAKYVH
jgi:hypothetical protein